MTEKDLNVLLLEDNPGDAFLIKFYLDESTSPVFNVMHAETMNGALELLAQNRFDIIISDMNLPDSTGVDTVRNLLSKYPGNLVIVLTGLTDEEVGLETVRFGAQDFLVKGKFDGKILVSSVMFAFERFKLNKQLDEENSRIESIQQLLNVGYFEVAGKHKSVFFSDYALKLLCFGPANPLLTQKERSAATAPDEELTKVIESAFDAHSSGERTYTQTGSGRRFQIVYRYQDGKLYGIIREIS